MEWRTTRPRSPERSGTTRIQTTRKLTTGRDTEPRMLVVGGYPGREQYHEETGQNEKLGFWKKLLTR